MTLLARVPPGRAGRMWLHRRLGTAERGRDQLDRKLRVLLPDLQRLRIQADRRRAEWVAACGDADTWLMRAVLIGGHDVIRHATPPDLADVELSWTTAIGVSFPSDAQLSASSQTAPAVVGNAATTPAIAAFRTALQTGIRAAAAEEAIRRMEAEVDVTRRRLRALDKRWLPALHQALSELEMSLAQAEQEDATRLRRAAVAPADPRYPP